MKYKDLNWENKDKVQYSFGHISKSKNPTIKFIISELERRAAKNEKTGATLTTIDQLSTANILRKCLIQRK